MGNIEISTNPLLAHIIHKNPRRYKSNPRMSHHFWILQKFVPCTLFMALPPTTLQNSGGLDVAIIHKLKQ